MTFACARRSEEEAEAAEESEDGTLSVFDADDPLGVVACACAPCIVLAWVGRSAAKLVRPCAAWNGLVVVEAR